MPKHWALEPISAFFTYQVNVIIVIVVPGTFQAFKMELRPSHACNNTTPCDFRKTTDVTNIISRVASMHSRTRAR